MNLDVHPFKCGQCKATRPHRLLKEYECPDIPEAPGTVWLVECQGCFDQRIIYPTERIVAKEDDIVRCDACGNWNMKSVKCRVCELAAGKQKLVSKIWTGSQTIEVPSADL